MHTNAEITNHIGLCSVIQPTRHIRRLLRDTLADILANSTLHFISAQLSLTAKSHFLHAEATSPIVQNLRRDIIFFRARRQSRDLAGNGGTLGECHCESEGWGDDAGCCCQSQGVSCGCFQSDCVCAVSRRESRVDCDYFCVGGGCRESGGGEVEG